MGYQPRNGTRGRLASRMPWLPLLSTTNGSARWATFCCGRNVLEGSLIGALAAARIVIRSAKNSPFSGGGTNERHKALTTP